MGKYDKFRQKFLVQDQKIKD